MSKWQRKGDLSFNEDIDVSYGGCEGDSQNIIQIRAEHNPFNFKRPPQAVAVTLSKAIKRLLIPDSRVRVYLSLLFIFLFSIILRSYVLIGHGLGDDPYYSYAATSFLEHGHSAIPLSYNANYRFGIHYPVAASFWMFGISDASFVLLPLLCSAFLVLLAFMIGNRFSGPVAGLFAALIQAVSTFDISFASTMTIDIPLAFAQTLAVYFFVCIGENTLLRDIKLSLAASFSALWAYYIKESGLAILPVLFFISLFEKRSISRYMIFFAVFASLFSLTFVLDYHVTGDVFNRFNILSESLASPAPFMRAWSDYPQWMFFYSYLYDNLFFGMHFWLAAAALIYCIIIKSARSKAAPAIIWALLLFAIMQFMPQKLSLPYEVPHRFFRHTYAFVPSAGVLAGIFLSHLWQNAKRYSVFKVIFILLLASYSADSIFRGVWLSTHYKSHYDDMKDASDFLLEQPKKTIVSDGKFRAEYSFRSRHKRMDQVPFRIGDINLQSDVVDGNKLRLLYDLEDAYVLVGGSRGVDHSVHWILNQAENEIPENWRLIYELDKPKTSHRLEPLRIYRAGPKSS